MIEIEKPKIMAQDIDGDSSKYGKFTVEPLERGYGATLGNSLRRILLSSLPGAAITNVQIEGALHEFSTLPGVVEDTTELILNLKKLVLRIFSEQEKTLELLKQDILTYRTDLETGDFEDKEFLKELNASIGYYNEYKRGQIVKVAEK